MNKTRYYIGQIVLIENQPTGITREDTIKKVGSKYAYTIRGVKINKLTNEVEWKDFDSELVRFKDIDL